MNSSQRSLRLLLIEIQPGQCESLQSALREGGFVVETHQAREAMQQQLMQQTSWDLVIASGDPADSLILAICDERRRQSKGGPLLVLGDSRHHTQVAGSSSGEAARVQALEAGADDVLLQPFGQAECLARCRALVRRHQVGRPPTTVLSHGALEMVVEEHLVRHKGEVVSLSPREFRLLHFLLEHQGRIWHREELLSRVWGELEALDFDPKTVDVHIHWLRLKLEDDPAHPTLITTVRGRGYCLG
jgi:two-component system, OmpR family, phosphate regulon response regulator PhoB